MLFQTTNPSIKLKVAQRPQLKAQILPKFPARVQGEGTIKVVRENAVYTFSDDWTLIDIAEGISDLTTTYVKVRQADGTYWRYSLDEIVGSTSALRTVTAAGDVTMLAADNGVFINKDSGEATGVTLLSAAGRNRPFTVVDGKGDAATNNITITPDGSETIIGQASWVINLPYGSVTLNPRPDGNGWYI